jgi:MFS family permease
MLLTELAHPQHRGPVTTIYNCLWNAGALLENALGWGTAQIKGDWSWRTIAFVQIVPSLVQLAFIYWIPESPRWLVSKDRADEALAILAKHHAGGDENNSTVQFEFREIRDTIKMEVSTKSSGYAEFFRTKGNRWRLAIVISLGVISQYSGNALFSNYANAIYEGAGIKQQNQKLALSVGQTALNLIVTICAALVVDKVGRRPLFLTGIGGMVVCFVCWTITGGVYENSYAGVDADGNAIYSNSGSGYAQLVFIWVSALDPGRHGRNFANCRCERFTASSTVSVSLVCLLPTRLRSCPTACAPRA